MDIRGQFYEWLLSNKLHKPSKAKEAMAVIEMADEKCVRSKGDGRFSLFDFVDLDTAKHIKKTFLHPNQVNRVLGKNANVFNKNIGFLFEFYETLVTNESAVPNGEQNASVANEATDTSSVSGDAVREGLVDVDTSEIPTVASQDSAGGKEPEAARPVVRVEKEKILVKKVNAVFSKVSKKLVLLTKEKNNTVPEEESIYFDLINAQLGVKSQAKIRQCRMADHYSKYGCIL